MDRQTSNPSSFKDRGQIRRLKELRSETPDENNMANITMWAQKKSPSNADAMIARLEAAPHNTSETTIISQGDFAKVLVRFPSKIRFHNQKRMLYYTRLVFNFHHF